MLRFLIFIGLHLIFTMSHGFAEDDASQRSCELELRVEDIVKIYPMVQGTVPPERLEEMASTDIILRPVTASQDIHNCQGYETITSLRMNNVSKAMPELNILQDGDILIGRLQYHAPQPQGKFLQPSYHNGLQIMKIRRGNDLLKDWSRTYMYYRYIRVEQSPSAEQENAP